MDTNNITLLQQALAASGHNVSTSEIALLCAGSGALIHLLHLAVNGYSRVGGYEGIGRFLKTGSSKSASEPLK